VIDPERVLSALEASGVKEIYLLFEILHRESYENEPRVIPEIRQSVQYWRQFLPKNQEIRLSHVPEAAKQK
jgi:hypothetical protein